MFARVCTILKFEFAKFALVGKGLVFMASKVTNLFIWFMVGINLFAVDFLLWYCITSDVASTIVYTIKEPVVRGRDYAFYVRDIVPGEVMTDLTAQVNIICNENTQVKQPGKRVAFNILFSEGQLFSKVWFVLHVLWRFGD